MTHDGVNLNAGCNLFCVRCHDETALTSRRWKPTDDGGVLNLSISRSPRLPFRAKSPNKQMTCAPHNTNNKSNRVSRPEFNLSGDIGAHKSHAIIVTYVTHSCHMLAPRHSIVSHYRRRYVYGPSRSERNSSPLSTRNTDFVTVWNRRRGNLPEYPGTGSKIWKTGVAKTNRQPYMLVELDGTMYEQTTRRLRSTHERRRVGATRWMCF